MALIGIFSSDHAFQAKVRGALDPLHGVADAPSWDVFLRTVRERPVAGAFVHLRDVRDGRPTLSPLFDIRRLFPSIGLVAVLDHHRDPGLLFELGQAGFENLVLLSAGGLEWELRRWLARSNLKGTTSTVLRALSPFVPPREMNWVKTALNSVHHCWSAEDFADVAGLSRPFLSERFKRSGLPSVGHFLIWVRMLHAANWLPDPGRTGQSVSRQLEYSSGAAFRRALRLYTGGTPTQVAESGGLGYVLERFMMACTLPRRGRPRRRGLA